MRKVKFSHFSRNIGMSDRGEDCVGGVALAAFEIAAAEMAVGLHVSDHGFDGGAAFEFALDGTVDAALLAGDEDTAPSPPSDRACRNPP
jgi:hypothetical protein